MTPLRLLILAPFPPRLDATHGGSRAIAELHAELGARHRIALLALRGPGDPPVDEALRGRCELVREVPRPADRGGVHAGAALAAGLASGVPMWVRRWSVPAFREHVAAVTAAFQPHIVQAEYHLMAQYWNAVEGRRPKVLRQLEPGAATAGERAGRRRGPARLLSWADGLAWRRYEAAAMHTADAVAALTEQDRDRLAPLAGVTPVVVIPLGTAIPAAAADPCGRRPDTVLFVGNFVHPPNLDAAERLVADIFPRVRRQAAAELRIVGPNPSAGLLAAAGDGIVVTGEVPSVREHLEDAAVVVAPLRQGGGMRVKVAEALAAGKAVVATPLAAEGLAVAHGEQLLIAESDEQLAAAIVRLLRSPAERASLAGRARAWARAELGWARPADAFERLYRSLLAPSGA